MNTRIFFLLLVIHIWSDYSCYAIPKPKPEVIPEPSNEENRQKAVDWIQEFWGVPEKENDGDQELEVIEEEGNLDIGNLVQKLFGSSNKQFGGKKDLQEAKVNIEMWIQKYFADLSGGNETLELTEEDKQNIGMWINTCLDVWKGSNQNAKLVIGNWIREFLEEMNESNESLKDAKLSIGKWTQEFLEGSNGSYEKLKKKIDNGGEYVTAANSVDTDSL